MNDQNNLPPISRTTDPSTSQESGDQITSSGRRACQIQAAVTAVKNNPHRTVNELAGACSLNAHQLSRRVSDAHSKGFIAPSGIRACQITKRKARTWASADKEA